MLEKSHKHTLILSFNSLSSQEKFFVLRLGFYSIRRNMTFSKTRLLVIFILLSIAVILPMRWVDGHLNTPDACCHFLGRDICSPVLCFEFAWTTEKANLTLAAWEDKLHYLTFGFGLDFLFLLLYPVVFFLGLQQIAAQRPLKWLQRIAAFFAPVALASGMFDAVENICLLRYIFGHQDEWLLKMAGVCAGIKFGLLVLGGIIIFSGSLASLYKWTKNWLKKV